MSIEGARVAWTEGLFLRPQHFQQQERFLEWQLHARIEQLVGFGEGFSELSFDDSWRRQGKLGLRIARGLFADGMPFQVPSEASPLTPLDVPEGVRDVMVYLTAGASRSDVKAFALDGDSSVRRAHVRYRAVHIDVPDNTVDGADCAEIQAGVLALGLTLESDLNGTMIRLPVARIRERSPAGEVILDETFIPPMLNAMAQPRLSAWVEELFGLVKQRGNMLDARISQQGSKGVTDYLLLQTCNRYESILAQWSAGLPVHPQLLFFELLKLAGECRTSDPKTRRIPSLPIYAHHDLATCFVPVVEEIRRQLVSVPDQTAVQISLVNHGRGFYTADIPDARMIRDGHFVLGISAQMPEARIRSEMAAFVRIGSPDRIQNLIKAQLYGVRIDVLPGAPIEIRYHAGFQYFQLDRASAEWPSIETARRIVLFVVGELPGLDLELWSIRQSNA